MEKPGKVQAIAIMTLVNGILNILASLTITFLIVVGTIGFGLLCAPLTLGPALLGVFEIIYGSKLLAENPVGVKPNPTMAILEICCIFMGLINSCVIGIIHLVFLNEPDVKAYFERIAA
jgi:hypothetical protein